ncbi:MAG: ATP synthase F1 subunit gamma [Alphaproteobacteria bacterium]|nr:ATP synthase F1 subunit gamma [Alphaproteobacteria bacterium]
MAGLKELRNRIEAIKSTQKITSAMKMVAASRLRRAQLALVKIEAYRECLYNTVSRILYTLRVQAKEQGKELEKKWLCAPKPQQQKYLLVILTSDRGLCGSYNSSIVRQATARIEELKASDKEVQIICLGYRGYNALKGRYGDMIIRYDESVVTDGVFYEEGVALADEISEMYMADKIDVCEIIYSRFISALNRDVVSEEVLPFDISVIETGVNDMEGNAYYEAEPCTIDMLELTVPLAFKEHIYDIMINTQASEQGARMTSMDNATRNATDMISKLTLRYNRLRQTAITTELTEIIAGAEAI